MKSVLYITAAVMFSAAISACHHPKKFMTAGDRATVHNNNVNIAYIDTGINDTTLLFVHGWAINKSYWKDQMDQFGDRYRVVAIDLPGFGQSGKNRNNWDTKNYASDVDSVIKQLDLKKVILVGHSMAGDIVLQSAIDNPDQVVGIVGVDNFKGVGQPEKPEQKAQFTAAMDSMKKHFKAVSAAWFNKYLFTAKSPVLVKTRILDDVAKADSNIAIKALLKTEDFSETDKLPKYKNKLYLINSDYTPTDTTWLSKNKVPFKIFYIKDTGHFPMVEDPANFNNALSKVIADIGKK